MTPIDTNHRLQIEDSLRRQLGEAELRQVDTLEELSDAQLVVFAVLARRDPITPILYLRAVVPGASFVQAHDLVSNIEQVLAARGIRT